ncbi:MAG: hypothetical protein F4Z31_01755 [Gemmatimonadetes bacterium]|nr:hypothetical protein [Gemmatimonadota bacterium]
MKAYLDALDTCNQTPELRDAQLESLNKRKKTLKAKLAKASSWQSLKIYSDIEEVDAQLDAHRKSKRAADRLDQLEPDFIAHAASYARTAGIPPQRFSKLGIDERVLVAAGLT